MNHLFIIFSENGKLHTWCEKLVDKTYKGILKETRMCFLNGKRTHLPKPEDIANTNESGILLVYDAHDNSAHDKSKTLKTLKQMSEKYMHLYVCYHTRSAESWEEEISALGLKLTKKSIIRSHPDEPYSFLHKFHDGEKSIEDLIVFWHEEEEKEHRKLINELCFAMYEAKEIKDVNHLKKFSDLESECNLSAEKISEYENIKSMIEKNAPEAEFLQAVKKFRTQ